MDAFHIAAVPADETAGAGLSSTVETAPPLTLVCTGLNLAPDPEKVRNNIQAQRDFIRKNFTPNSEDTFWWFVYTYK